jgi:predicted ATPase
MNKKEKKIIEKLRQAIEEQRSIRFHNLEAFSLCLLAEVCAEVGQIEESLITLEEAQGWMKKTGECLWEAELYRLRGECLFSQLTKDKSNMESCFNQALKITQRQQAKSLELRAAMSMSRLWQSQGKKEEARRLLSEIYGWFTEGFDTADLKDAKSLLDELS